MLDLFSIDSFKEQGWCNSTIQTWIDYTTVAAKSLKSLWLLLVNFTIEAVVKH